MLKEELYEKLVDVRRVSDSDDCCSFCRGCAEVDLWVCSTKWKKFKRKTTLL